MKKQNYGLLLKILVRFSYPAGAFLAHTGSMAKWGEVFFKNCDACKKYKLSFALSKVSVFSFFFFFFSRISLVFCHEKKIVTVLHKTCTSEKLMCEDSLLCFHF